MTGKRSYNREGDGAAERRALGLLLEGICINLPQIDPEAYRRFRNDILRDSMRITEPQREAGLLNITADLIREFESYRGTLETAMERREKEWRQLVLMLVNCIGLWLRTEQKAEPLSAVLHAVTEASTSDEIQALHQRLQLFISQGEDVQQKRLAKAAEEKDVSTGNDNVAGLRGGGAAVEHVRRMIAESKSGYISLFQLNCLDVVGERFGPEGIQDCVIAVASFLIESLRSEDVIYHWSESTLLSVCERKIREEILIAELNRVLARNRDFTIQIGDRTIMVRIPIEVKVFPLSSFTSAEDLQNLSTNRTRKDRSAVEPTALWSSR